MNYVKKIVLLALLSTQALFPLTDKEKAEINQFIASDPSLWRPEQVKDVFTLLQTEDNYANAHKKDTLSRKWADELAFRQRAQPASRLKEMPTIIEETIRPYSTILEQDTNRAESFTRRVGKLLWLDWDNPIKTKDQRIPQRITPKQRSELEKIVRAQDTAKEILALDTRIAELEKVKAITDEKRAIEAFTELEKRPQPYFTQRSLKYAYEKALAATGSDIYNRREALARKAEPLFQKLLEKAYESVMRNVPLNAAQEKELTDAQFAARFSLSKESGANAHLTELVIEKSKTLKTIQELSREISPANKARIEEAKKTIKNLNEQLIKIKKGLEFTEKEREKEAAEAKKEEDRARRTGTREEIKKQRDEEERELKRKEAQRAAEEKIKEIRKQREEDEKEYAAQEKALATREQEREKGEDLARRGQIAAEHASEL